MEEVGARRRPLDEGVRKDNGERKFMIARDEATGSCHRLDVLVLREVLLVEEDDAVVLDDDDVSEEAAAILSNNGFSSLSVGIKTRVRTERRRHLLLM